MAREHYEYVDLGRFWRIYLLVGLLLWVALVLRGVWPALRQPQEGRSLIALVVVATVAIGLLFGAGLMYGKDTHISTTIIFLGGGVLGTFHHLYFSGTPIGVIALGSVFPALEVVPLVVIGFEAYGRARHEGLFDWQKAYHWPFMFFGSVLVWNLVGAGLLGFLINPPLALYYMQGLNTTPTHGHAALFGVYGMLGLGLMLFCMRGLTDPARWNNRLLSFSFWCFNIGLAMMVLLSLLPQGLWQTYASFTRDYAYARSAEVIQGPVMQALVWARVPGDLVFACGVLTFAAFVVQEFLSGRTARVPRAAAAVLDPR